MVDVKSHVALRLWLTIRDQPAHDWMKYAVYRGTKKGDVPRRIRLIDILRLRDWWSAIAFSPNAVFHHPSQGSDSLAREFSRFVENVPERRWILVISLGHRPGDRRSLSALFFHPPFSLSSPPLFFAIKIRGKSRKRRIDRVLSCLWCQVVCNRKRSRSEIVFAEMGDVIFYIARQVPFWRHVATRGSRKLFDISHFFC